MFDRCRFISVLLCVAALYMSAGCATSAQTSTAPTDATTSAQVEQAAKPLEPGIYDVQTGERLRREDFYATLAERRFVAVGESHDDPWHHRVEADIVTGISRFKQGGAVVVGMEMFQRPYQEALDAYVAGDIDEETMLERAEWETRWSYSVAFYAPLWQHMRASKGALFALNARRELSKRTASVGVEGLSPSEREDLPEMDLTNEAHRSWFMSLMGQHGGAHSGQTEGMERFYQAQVVWDETMAETAYLAMKERPPADTMVVVAGSAHVMHGWGIPSRITRRLVQESGWAPEKADEEVVIVLPVSAPDGGRESLVGRSGATRADLGMWRSQKTADYVWVQ